MRQLLTVRDCHHFDEIFERALWKLGSPFRRAGTSVSRRQFCRPSRSAGIESVRPRMGGRCPTSMNPPATRLLVLGPALGDRDVCRMRVSVSMDQRTRSANNDWVIYDSGSFVDNGYWVTKAFIEMRTRRQGNRHLHLNLRNPGATRQMSVPGR